MLDCGSQIFTRLGLSSADDDTDRHQSQQSAMQALVQQLVHDRLPAPSVLRIDQVGLLLHMRLFMQPASAVVWHTEGALHQLRASIVESEQANMKSCAPSSLHEHNTVFPPSQAKTWQCSAQALLLC